MSELETIRRLIGAGREAELRALADELARLRAELQQLDRELPAMLHRIRSGPHSTALSQAISPVVAEALGGAIQRDRGSIAEALAPVMGPGIRKAISDAMRGLMDDINRIVEQSLTLRSLRWRWEAMRTGVPFAQVALQHSFRYKVDHLLLIDNHSSELLMARSAPGIASLDRDAVAGMLSAITDFVVDTMQGGSRHDAGLASATIGEHLVQVYEGSDVRIALFLQGAPSRSLAEDVWQCLASIERLTPEPDFQTDGGWHLAAEAAIDNISLEGSSRADPAKGRPPRSWLWVMLLLAVLTGIAWFAFERWNQSVERTAIWAQVEQQPGWVPLKLELSDGWQLSVLRDPDAVTAAHFKKHVSLSARRPVGIKERAFLSMEPVIVLARAHRVLQPPEALNLELKGDTLVITGEVQNDWLISLGAQPLAIAGVVRLDLENVRPLGDEWLEQLSNIKDSLNSVFFVLEPGETIGSPDLQTELDVVLNLSLKAVELATELDREIRLRIYGWSDPTGPTELNRQLRMQRAEWLSDQLALAGVPAHLVLVDPEGRLGDVPGISLDLEWEKLTDEF